MNFFYYRNIIIFAFIYLLIPFSYSSNLFEISNLEYKKKFIGLEFKFIKNIELPKINFNEKENILNFTFKKAISQNIILPKKNNDIFSKILFINNKVQFFLQQNIKLDIKNIKVIYQKDRVLKLSLFDIKDKKTENLITYKNMIKKIYFNKEKNHAVFKILLPKNYGKILVSKHNKEIFITLNNLKIAKKWTYDINVNSFDTFITEIQGKNGNDSSLFRLISNINTNSLDYFYKIEKGYFILNIFEKNFNFKLLDKSKKFNINFKNMPLNLALENIAKLANLNLVTNKNIKDKITLNIENSTWQDILDVVLMSYNLDKIIVGNILYVSNSKDIINYQKSMEKEQNISNELEDLEVIYLPLNYADAKSIYNILNKNDSVNYDFENDKETNNNFYSMLSSRGSISYDNRTNTLILKDNKKNLKNIISVIKKLDIPLKQVLIEAKIVELSKQSAQIFGVDWNASSIPLQSNGNIRGTSNFNFNSSETTGSNTVLGISFSKIFESIDLNLELKALESEGNAKIVSTPHIIVSNNEEATISQGKDIPYQEESESGGTTISFKKAELELKVKPKISLNNNIILEITMKKDTASNEVLAGNIPIINTRTIQTKLMMKNRETIVLGGIYEINKNISKSKIPLLGDIPLLKWLFTSESYLVIETELLVFITPKVIDL